MFKSIISYLLVALFLSVGSVQAEPKIANAFTYDQSDMKVVLQIWIQPDRYSRIVRFYGTKPSESKLEKALRSAFPEVTNVRFMHHNQVVKIKFEYKEYDTQSVTLWFLGKPV